MGGMRETFQAAFSTVDITPVDLRRVGRLGINILMPTGIHSRLSARLALFEAGGMRVALCIADLNVLLDPVALEIRQAIARGAELPLDHVLFGWTHTHNAPATWPWLTQDNGHDYLDFLIDRIEPLAAKTAHAMRPCRMEVVRSQAPGLSFSRRPLYRQPDGRLQAGTHGPRHGDDFVRMEGPDESELLVLRATGMDGTPLGGIVNFAAHPTCTYPVALFSADYPGALRAAMEERHGGTWMFMNGAAGNLSHISTIPERPDASRTELADYIGQQLAEYAGNALCHAVDIGHPQVRAMVEILPIPQRLLLPRMVEIARGYLETTARGAVWDGTLSEQLYGYAYHFHHRSPQVDDWLARDILGMWEWRRRIGSRKIVEDVVIQVIRLGDVGLAAFPCELFNEFAVELRAASPFRHTFIAQMTNGWHGYIPPAMAFDHGGYECCFAMQSRLVPEAGQLMTDAAGRQLRYCADEA